MFKKLLVASLILGSNYSLAFAENLKADYKNELVPPCPTYVYTAGPYLGLSVGPIVNIASGSAFQGYTGNLNVGYGKFLQPAFYLAAEVFVEGIGQFKNYESADDTSPRQTLAYGFDVIPGFLVTHHVLAYLRGGIDRGHFNNTGDDHNATGWRVGVGGQTNVYQNWDIRGEYVYNQYNSLDNIGKVLSNQFNFGVVYKFV